MTEELKQKAIKASDKKCVKGCSKYYRYGFQDGYIAGATENGIQWHDLRKDPNDLPSDYRSVWTNQGGAYYDIESKSWADGDSWVYDVIAWCEPQFKEQI